MSRSLSASIKNALYVGIFAQAIMSLPANAGLVVNQELTWDWNTSGSGLDGWTNSRMYVGGTEQQLFEGSNGYLRLNSGVGFGIVHRHLSSNLYSASSTFRLKSASFDLRVHQGNSLYSAWPQLYANGNTVAKGTQFEKQNIGNGWVNHSIELNNPIELRDNSYPLINGYYSSQNGPNYSDIDEIKFIGTEELADLPSAKISIDGNVYTVPTTKGFYSEIRDGDGNVIEGGVSATVAARLYAASQMLYDIENFNGQQLVEHQFEAAEETQAELERISRWDTQVRTGANTVPIVAAGTAVAAGCAAGAFVPVAGWAGCGVASATWAVGSAVSIGADYLQHSTQAEQSTFIYDAAYELLENTEQLIPLAEKIAAKTITNAQNGTLTYDELVQANLQTHRITMQDRAITALLNVAPMDTEEAEIVLSNLVSAVPVVGPIADIWGLISTTDELIDKDAEIRGIVDTSNYYDSAHVSNNAISLYADIALSTGLAGSSKTNQKSVQQTVDNFDSGSLGDNWLVEGPGSASIEEIFVLDSLESVLLLETGSPISVAQELFNTPDSPFYIDFDYLFGTTTGQLDIYFNDLLLDSLFAADFTGDDFLTHTLAINDPSFYGLSSSMLEFYFDGDTGSQVFIDNISLNSVVSEVPEPESIAIFALGLTGLALGRRRRNSKH